MIMIGGALTCVQKPLFSNIRHRNVIKNVANANPLQLESSRRRIRLSSTTFTQSVPKSTEFGEITLRVGVLHRSRSSKVTAFGTNRKVIHNFLLVINSNLTPILHRFRYIAFRRSKIAIFAYPSWV